MDTSIPDSTAIADLHLLLARAFLPPLEATFARAFVEDLPEDLADIAAQLPFDCAASIDALRKSVVGLGHDGLLQAYSALFLQPPQRASLDASVYLDGAARGPSSLEVEERYARHGLACDARLRELPDHLSRLFEFSAYLLAREPGGEGEREAREFVGTYLRPWVPALAVEIRAACDELALPRPYQHLAELAAFAAWEGEGWRRGDAHREPERSPKQAHCVQCARPYAEDAALRAVRRIMKKKGLPMGHLDRCENCRGLTDDVTGTVEPAEMRAL